MHRDDRSADPERACESERLHLSGAIQPFGALLALDADECRVTHASANLSEFATIEAHALLGAALPTSPAWRSLRAAATGTPGRTTIRGDFANRGGRRVDARLIRRDGYAIVELEPIDETSEPLHAQQWQRALLDVPRDRSAVAAYHDVLIDAIRRITGFDRATIYRFGEDWSGEVIAESKNAGMGSFLGLRFPSSDIPENARRLYMINPARMIPDAAAAPVPILSAGGLAPDLSESDLRSVSPMHLEYLANMGARASFSVPIRVAGRMWGLVTCHHPAAVKISPDRRDLCVSLTAAYALGLTSYLAAGRLRLVDGLERRIEGMLARLVPLPNPLDGLDSAAEALMEALEAQGVAMAIGDEVAIAGDGPALEDLALIDDWFVRRCMDTVYSTDRLAGLIPEHLAIIPAASGMIAIKGRTQRSGWVRLYWFRPAEPQCVSWAGNPNKSPAPNGSATLTPRRSFERWVEEKIDCSRPWSAEHLLVARTLRHQLISRL